LFFNQYRASKVGLFSRVKQRNLLHSLENFISCYKSKENKMNFW
jgi:hypothetical protein